MKNRVLLENYYLPGELERAVEAFVEHYNQRRYHECIGDLKSADVYFSHAETILSESRKTKDTTMKQRRLMNQKRAA